MDRYRITLMGTRPLLLHHDDIDWADAMDGWRHDATNAANSKAGDDRTPAWRWIGSLYRDEAQVVIPTANIMRALMEGGAMVPVPGAKGNKTFKSQSQSGIMPAAGAWPLMAGGRSFPWDAIKPLLKIEDFARHQQLVGQLGFELFKKRVKIGQSKHVRVRPMFTGWSATGELVVSDKQITKTSLESILACAGKYKGLGDWRPGSKTPGSFGMFEATVEAL